jgi:hypothetical protein
MQQYVGLDVSQKKTAVCVMDDAVRSVFHHWLHPSKARLPRRLPTLNLSTRRGPLDKGSKLHAETQPIRSFWAYGGPARAVAGGPSTAGGGPGPWIAHARCNEVLTMVDITSDRLARFADTGGERAVEYAAGAHPRQPSCRPTSASASSGRSEGAGPMNAATVFYSWLLLFEQPRCCG